MSTPNVEGVKTSVTGNETRQLERLFDRMKELRQAPPKRNGKTIGSIKGPSRLHSRRFDSTKNLFIILSKRHQYEWKMKVIL